MLQSELLNYKSPEVETSLFKNVPIAEYTPEFRAMIRQMVQGREMRYLFRGPRPKSSGRFSGTRQSYCLKQDAVTFAVYIRR